MDMKQELEAIVDHWCPKTCQHEPFQVRIMRALLEANVTAMAAREKFEGRPSIRPYEICTAPPASFEELFKRKTPATIDDVITRATRL